MKKEQFEMIICVVLPQYSETVLKVARDMGVTGATFFKGRGTGIHETESFFGVEIQPEKEIIMMVVAKDKRKSIMQEIAQVSGINTEAHGLCFSLPIEEWTGIVHLEKPKSKKEEQIRIEELAIIQQLAENKPEAPSIKEEKTEKEVANLKSDLKETKKTNENEPSNKKDDKKSDDKKADKKDDNK